MNNKGTAGVTLIPIDIEFGFENGTITADITITIPLPSPPFPPLNKVDAHEWPSQTNTLIRWHSDEPFLLIPQDSRHWQKKDWPSIPDASRWLLVLSQPDPQGGHYLELWTRTKTKKPSKNSKTNADYWVLPLSLPGVPAIKTKAFKKLKPAFVKALRELLEILASKAVKATIIISE